MSEEPDPKLEALMASLEPPYKSRGEAQVGRLLDRYNVPFYYEQPLLVLDRGQHRCWHPDFTLPEYNNLIIEYAGMLDVPDYAAGIRHKQRAYDANEIPALFVYPQDLKGPNWPEKLYHQIEEAGRWAFQAHRQYSAYNPSGPPR